MPLELAAALKLLLPVAKTVAPVVLTQVKKKLNPTELQKALEVGIQEAQTREAALPELEQLFLKSPPEEIRGFIEDVFKHGIAVDELRRPLNDEGIPRVVYLAEAFKQVAEGHPKIAPQESRIELWLDAFARAYFEKTDTYLKYQIARDVYLKQLEQRFEEIRFGGIDIEGQEAERS
ncbi:MAG: signal transduction protein, partial [Cyanobacteria bacterium P01_F01_bin.4]